MEKYLIIRGKGVSPGEQSKLFKNRSGAVKNGSFLSVETGFNRVSRNFYNKVSRNFYGKVSRNLDMVRSVETLIMVKYKMLRSHKKLN